MKDKLRYQIEFEELVEGNLYTISIINEWLLKYYKCYKRINKINNAMYLHRMDDKLIRLPPICSCSTADEKFLSLYNELDKISKFNLWEAYLKQELYIYRGIKNQPEKVKNWLTKNEYLGAEKYFMFSLDYFGDKDEMENENHLHILFLEDIKYEVFVDRSDFKHTIEFANTFNNIYWELLDEMNVQNLVKN